MAAFIGWSVSSFIQLLTLAAKGSGGGLLSVGAGVVTVSFTCGGGG